MSQVGNTTYTTNAGNVDRSTLNQGYITTANYINGPSVVREQTLIGGNTVYGGNSTYGQTYTSGPTDYKLVNQTYASTTGGYSRLGGNAQNLVQKVVAE